MAQTDVFPVHSLCRNGWTDDQVRRALAACCQLSELYSPASEARGRCSQFIPEAPAKVAGVRVAAVGRNVFQRELLGGTPGK